MLSKDGILPDPNKITAIQNIQTSTSVTQVKSFLGITNFCNRFTPNYLTLTEPLWNLTQKDTHHSEAFHTLKSSTIINYNGFLQSTCHNANHH